MAELGSLPISDEAWLEWTRTGSFSTESAPEPAPSPTGNVAVDQANILSSILNSPLYTESIKNAYLTQYLPGLTQANYEINRARAAEVQNATLRQQAQAQAIRDIAGSYAARGLRTPKMITEGFAPVQQQTQQEKNAAEAAINALIAEKEVLYGVGATDKETFITDPTKFGSIGAGARRAALSELQQLPEIYGLTQVAMPSSYPGASDTTLPTEGASGATDSGTAGSGETGGIDNGEAAAEAARAAAQAAARQKAAREKAAREEAARQAAAQKKAAEAARKAAESAARRSSSAQGLRKVGKAMI